MPEKNFKSGFIALVGRPNSGKSTLLNAVIGKKVAITSNVAQTTRNRIRAILNTDDMQAIFVDTPGLHKPHDVLGQELNESVNMAVSDVDIVVVVIDASEKFGSGDKWVIDSVKNLNAIKFCVISKVDKVTDDVKISQLNAATKLTNWDACVCLSSKNNFNIEAFIREIKHFLPVGPAWFPKDTLLDQDLNTTIAEFVREKVLINTREEVPHSVGVETEYVDFEKKKNLYKIFVNIFVEKKSQKGILIGKNGDMIKKIGIDARKDLEQFFNARVYLDLDVKIKKDWRKDYNQVRKFGYTAE